MTCNDAFFGNILAIIYRARPTVIKQEDSGSNAVQEIKKPSIVLIGSHGTSGFVNVTLGPQSRYFDACKNLHPDHAHSQVRQALAIASLRAYATMDNFTRNSLVSQLLEKQGTFDWDETSAGALASRFHLCDTKYPSEIGNRVLELGGLEPKCLKTLGLDVVYEDSDTTIEQSNELVYLLGEQMERLFDPLAEYTPEFAENIYVPPTSSYSKAQRMAADDPELVKSICQELYLVQSHFHLDLMDFIHDFLVPLRIAVLEEASLANQELDAGPATINSIFPPTIDEIARANSLLYDALQQALPFGSLETLKSCGMTIPYFYKACLRHEAATKNITASLAVRGKLIYSRVSEEAARKYTIRRIESILACGGHLLRIRLVLERLVAACTQNKVWKDHELVLANEYYDSACGTIDAFARQQSAGSYERHVFTRSGRLLVEIASDWPKELEFGWLSRRVVSIFDAQALLHNSSAGTTTSASAARPRTHTRTSHEQTRTLTTAFNRTHIVIVFTDYIVIIETERPISLVSASGIHIPSVADMLMHSMINEVPLKNVPAMRVIAWIEIGNVYAAEYSGDPGQLSTPESVKQGSSYLSIFTPTGFHRPASARAKRGSIGENIALYKLVRKDNSAGKIVELIVKAKVVAKTQPFHLFRTATQKMLLYSTVHEVRAYGDETQRLPICVFLNLKATKSTLDIYGLLAAVNVAFVNPTTVSHVRIQVLTKLGYNSEEIVERNKFSSKISSISAYLYTLLLSSANSKYLSSLINYNKKIANVLVEYANEEYSDSEIDEEDEDQESITNVGKENDEPTANSGGGGQHLTPTVRGKPENSILRRASPSQYLKKIVHKNSLKKFWKIKDKTKKSSATLVTNISEDANEVENKEPSKSLDNKPSALCLTTPSVTPVKSNDESVEQLTTTLPTETTTDQSSPEDEDANSSIRLVSRTRTRPSMPVERDHISEDDEEFSAWEDVTDTTASFSSTALSDYQKKQQQQVDAWFLNGTKDDETIGEMSSQWSTSSSSTHRLQPLMSNEGSSYASVRAPLADKPLGNNMQEHPLPKSPAQQKRRQQLEKQQQQKQQKQQEQQQTKEPSMSQEELLNIIRQQSLSLSLDQKVADQYNKHARKNSFAPIQTGEMSRSHSFATDFGYLAGAVSIDVQTPPEDEGTMSREDSGRLYPDLRDSSIVFLREAISADDDEDSMDMKSRDNSQTSLAVPPRRKRESFTPTFKFPPPPLPISTSFRQLINESSVNTLQLASFTVQVERLMDDVDPLAKAELALVRDWIIILYEETRSLTEQLIPAEELPLFEKSCKKRACACLWIVIWLQSRNKAYHTRYQTILQDLLDLEWIRRTKLWQAVDPNSYKLW